MDICKDTISNERLSLTFRLPRKDVIWSKRFDAAGCIQRVVLDGKHQFCEPEMVVVGRPDTHGCGLNGEFKWDKIAQEVKPGEQFPKFGVGLLRQLPDGEPYSHIKHDLYEVEPFVTEYEIGETSAKFVQHCKKCIGLAATITREYKLDGNKLYLTLTVKNEGDRDINMHEYEHNFVSIDHIPMGPGYHLELPYDKGMDRFPKSVFLYGQRGNRVPDALKVNGHTLEWNKYMTDLEMSAAVGKEDIDFEKGLSWTLSHDDSPASIRFSTDSTADLIVYWSIAQCVCEEWYVPFNLKPGEAHSVNYTWEFND